MARLDMLTSSQSGGEVQEHTTWLRDWHARYRTTEQTSFSR